MRTASIGVCFFQTSTGLAGCTSTVTMGNAGLSPSIRNLYLVLVNASGSCGASLVRNAFIVDLSHLARDSPPARSAHRMCSGSTHASCSRESPFERCPTAPLLSLDACVSLRAASITAQR